MTLLWKGKGKEKKHRGGKKYRPFWEKKKADLKKKKKKLRRGI